MEAKSKAIIMIVCVVFAYAIVRFITMKLIWEKQMSWTEVIILIPIVAIIAVIEGYQLMKQDKGT